MRRDLLMIPVLATIVVTTLPALGPGRRLELPRFANRRRFSRESSRV